MSFRTKLLTMFTVTVVVVVTVVAWLTLIRTRKAFDRFDRQRSLGVVDQFHREFDRRGAEITQNVEGIAGRDATTRMALKLSGPTPDYSPFEGDAQSLAPAHQLEFLELVAADGTLISSAQYRARYGYKEPWLLQSVEWNNQPAFLKREKLPDGVALALIAVRTVRVNDQNLYIAGGRKIDQDFLRSLVLPPRTRALLYANLEPVFAPQNLTDVSGPVSQAEKLAPLIATVQQTKAEASEIVAWNGNESDSETFQAIPLKGREGELLGVLLLGTSRHELVVLQNQIRVIALIAGVIGVLLGILLSSWAAARITRPVKQLAGVARDVAAGDWNARVEVESADELGQLADAFNAMTHELTEQRDRLMQAERVAAWRELARRLAHELKNPLFPLQITVENLLRARESAEFEEVFKESTTTLLAELANLKAIIGRFSDFAKMPKPELRPVAINALVQEVVKVFEAQLSAPGRPAVTLRLRLDDGLVEIFADPDLLHRALSNLVLNAIDAMPQGGTLTLRTEPRDGGVRIEVSDTGSGLTREECERLFTPYYTTKQHGTGLGLAIVQSVVSDHCGSISVQSVPGRGTTFRIDLPERPSSMETEAKATNV